MRLPEPCDSSASGVWQPVNTPPIAGKTAVVIGFGDLGRGAGRAAKQARADGHRRDPQRQGRAPADACTR